MITNKKTFIFISETNFKNKRLTGAHKRFLELVRTLAERDDVILVTNEIPQLQEIKNITFYYIKESKMNFPSHIKGIIDIWKVLHKIKKNINYDYAISFGASSTLCYFLAGYNNIVSLFREDTIGYLKCLKISRLRMLYFTTLEKIAVKKSSKIIVQCINDKKSLVERNVKHCKDVERKTYIQINNANASWMSYDSIKCKKSLDGVVRVLFIGDFSNKRKGHSVLLPAFKKLIDEGYKVELFVAGDGDELKSYSEIYKEYEKIHFLGRVDIKEYISVCDFELVPSFIDSCPNTILEGLNAGITVYGANTGGIPDLLEKEEYLFNPDSNSIYSFVRDVIDKKRYINDLEKQKSIKNNLTFNWGLKIRDIILNEVDRNE